MTKIQEEINNNMWKIDYKQFLLTQLLRDMDQNESYDTLAYDVLWDLSFEILNEYKKVENINIDLYSDLEHFIKNNREYLLKLYEWNV